MIMLPIKKKWFDMIKSGEKKEEYREIKPYWTKRLTKNLPMWETGFVKFRNGYGNDKPTITCKVLMSKRQGKEEWGAEPGKEYYVLEILEVLEQWQKNKKQ